MSNVLMGYLNQRLKNDLRFEKTSRGDAVPVVTISREVGCGGIKLANLIALQLNRRTSQKNRWRVLSKEIFYQSAIELEMQPEHVRRIFKQTDKYSFEEILKAFNNKNYKSERKIISTVIDVVRSCATDGYAIIVGRAGHIIAGNINNSIHIRLMAPLEFRIKSIRESNGFTREKSIEFINRVEQERILFRKAIRKENLPEEIFDLTFNCAAFSTDAIVKMILTAMVKKGIKEPDRVNLQYF